MIIYANSRGSEKTANAIKMAASTNSVLVVSQERVDVIEKQAIEMGYPIHVISAKQYFNRRNERGCRDCERIVIDDIDTVLRNLFGCEVVMATTIGCVANIEIKEGPEDDPKFKWLHKY